MSILRIIDRETGLFLRDDFTFDSETEIGLNVEPSQGLIQPQWQCEIISDMEVCEWKEFDVNYFIQEKVEQETEGE